MNKKIHGISYGSVCNSSEEKLKSYNKEFKCLELPANDIDEMERIISVYCQDDIIFGIHYPSQYSIKCIEFDIFDDKKVYEIAKNFQSYIDAFPKANYYLLHFPQNIEPYIYTKEELLEKLKRFLSLVKYDKDKLVIENLSNFDAITYKYLLENIDSKFCLDIGHAHLINSQEVNKFFDCMKNKIKVLHIYNTSNDKENQYYALHLPSYKIVESAIDIDLVEKKINELEQDLIIIDESYYKFIN